MSTLENSTFWDFPLALCEEDLSGVQQYLAALQAQGITDFRAFFAGHPEEMKACIGKANAVSANRRFLSLLGIQAASEFQEHLDIFFPPDTYPYFQEVLACLAEGRTEYESEWMFRNRQGQVKHVVFRMVLAPGYEASFGKAYLSLLDITERKNAEEALRQSELQYRSTIDSIHDYIHVVDADCRLLLVNQSLQDWLKKNRNGHPILGRTVFEVFPFLPQAVRSEYEQVFRTGQILITEECNEVYGNIIHSETRKIPVRGDGTVSRVITIIRDFTQRKEMEKKLHTSLAEKEILLRELHHRVKNHLEMIGNLLHLPEEYSRQADPARILADCRQRVKTVAMIHDRLHQARDLDEVELSAFLRELAGDIFQSFPASLGQIRLQFQLHPILVPVDQAICCGMILNELLSNALQYAFPEQRSGEIQIHLSQKQGLITMVLTDDGVGIPKGFYLKSLKSFGLNLVLSLAHQLAAEIKLDASRGTAFTLQFLPRKIAEAAPSPE